MSSILPVDNLDVKQVAIGVKVYLERGSSTICGTVVVTEAQTEDPAHFASWRIQLLFANNEWTPVQDLNEDGSFRIACAPGEYQVLGIYLSMPETEGCYEFVPLYSVMESIRMLKNGQEPAPTTETNSKLVLQPHGTATMPDITIRRIE